MSTTTKGKFIVIEGFDGTGKTTLTRHIAEEFPVMLISAPGGQFAKARDYFDIDKATAVERFGFYFGENIRVSEYVREQTDKGVHILMERYFLSTFVYHDFLYPELSRRYRGLFPFLYQPDIVLLVKSDFEKIQKRIQARTNNDIDDAFYVKKESYEKIYASYAALTSALCMNVVSIENNGSFEDMAETTGQIIKSVIS